MTALPSDYFSVAQVAILLAVDPTTVRRWVHHNALEGVRLPYGGTRTRIGIPREAIARLLNPQAS